VARQWHDRCPETEASVATLPGVSGLVFSTFRHDNRGSLVRGDFRA
jgi:hypothetical protein